MTVEPEDGFGPVNDEAYLEVPRDQIPEEAHVEGAELQTSGPDGEELFPIVCEVKEESLVLDFNHPLAGRTLLIKLKVLDVQPAGSSEDETSE